MKIAISAEGKTLDDNIDMRFGRCAYFLIVNIENNEIKETQVIENTANSQAGGAGITAVQIVGDQEVEAVISTNLGPRAFDAFNQLKIKVYTASGKIRDAIQELIEGKLKVISNPTGPQHQGMK